MAEKTIEEQLAEVEYGDHVRVIYSKHPKRNIVKTKAGYSPSRNENTSYIFVASEIGYDKIPPELKTMGEVTFILAGQILKFQILRKRAEVESELECLLGTEKKVTA